MVFAEYEWEYDWKFSGLPAKVAFNVAGTGFSYRRVIQKCWNFQTRPRKVMQIYGTPVMSPRTTLMSTLDVYLHLGKVTINQWIYWVPQKNGTSWFGSLFFLDFTATSPASPSRDFNCAARPPDPALMSGTPGRMPWSAPDATGFPFRDPTNIYKHGINRIRIDELNMIDAHWSLNKRQWLGREPDKNLRLSLIMGVDQK